MTFFFEGLTEATFSLTILYLLLAVYCYRRLVWLQKHTSKNLNTKKLFVMTCLVTAILRTMSFASMTILDLGEVHFQIHSTGTRDDDDPESTDEFFEKASLVLFDFPDFCFISAYVLLMVVWSEMYLKSRRHWLSSFKFRKFWMLGYFFFNLLLYTVQLSLYSLLFFPSVNQSLLSTLIYLALAGFNLVLPLCWSLIYLYLAIQFAGFPNSSLGAQRRLQTLSRLGTLWTVARLGWGVVALTSVVEGWFSTAQRSRAFNDIFLIAIFFCVEIVPITFSLQPSVLQCLSENDSIPTVTEQNLASAALLGNSHSRFTLIDPRESLGKYSSQSGGASGRNSSATGNIYSGAVPHDMIDDVSKGYIPPTVDTSSPLHTDLKQRRAVSLGDTSTFKLNSVAHSTESESKTDSINNDSGSNDNFTSHIDRLLQEETSFRAIPPRSLSDSESDSYATANGGTPRSSHHNTWVAWMGLK